jgi:hypothetical protein
MAAICTTPVKAFLELESKPNIVGKRVVGDNVVTTEIFTGPRIREVQAAMDARQQELEAVGGQMVHRTSVGRNTPCPCGSGLKFKKCCIDKALLVG